MNRLKQVLETYRPHYDPGSLPSRKDGHFVLVEKNTHDGSYWFSGHQSPEEAANYHDGQEYQEDWSIETLVDLTTGEEFEADTRTTFVRGGEPAQL